MADDKNRLRRQVVDEVSAGFARAMRSDRKGFAILLLQVVNAVWFAALWARGFQPVLPVMAWGLFFVVSLAAMIAIERTR
ncbi:hypothetical protein [Thiomonas bhubaneswarensis]|uniref:Uncharacterized protein n=1 Tax=Thiomonas bhubaneswarensis TaxID=339866 RepID=A0A0K6I1D9_9BURK|nr:hypothetical protein [Thiomonas bhubaneswarensis]CUA96878.1 hypothetical protein Ga0061069_10510 [Thiomonas bhubaneswarensis]